MIFLKDGMCFFSGVYDVVFIGSVWNMCFYVGGREIEGFLLFFIGVVVYIDIVFFFLLRLGWIGVFWVVVIVGLLDGSLFIIIVVFVNVVFWIILIFGVRGRGVYFWWVCKSKSFLCGCFLEYFFDL